MTKKIPVLSEFHVLLSSDCSVQAQKEISVGSVGDDLFMEIRQPETNGSVSLLIVDMTLEEAKAMQAAFTRLLAMHDLELLRVKGMVSKP